MKTGLDIDWSLGAPPLTFETEECIQAFAEQVYREHEVIAGQYTCFGAGEGQAEAVMGRIESVVANCFGSFFGSTTHDRFSDVFEQASCFAVHLAKDHIFADGNKRTALVVALAIVKMRPVDLLIDDGADPDGNAIYWWIQSAVSGPGDQAALAADLRGMARPSAR